MRYALILVLLSLCLSVQAEMSIETINLHNRSAQDVIPVLRPLLDKGASLTGTGYKLFIKSSPDNIAQIRHMLGEIDVAAKNLLVSVSMDPAVMHETTDASAHIQINSGNTRIEAGKNGVTASGGNREGHHPRRRIMYDAHLLQEMHQQRAPAAQTVRVTEGLWATIRTGQAIPIATRTRHPDGTVTDTYTYQAVASGFQVLPRVHGDNVTLTIRPQAQAVKQSSGGTYDTTELETTVSGRLGHWIAIGGVSQTQQSSSTGILSQAQQRQSNSNQIYVKVELANP